MVVVAVVDTLATRHEADVGDDGDDDDDRGRGPTCCSGQ